ncbi:MAG: hypothetical protein C0402_12505 [Thermodesulfovibrio sp.]|nr:hypothetical protein [Thermodesulfovibrio sp.]
MTCQQCSTENAAPRKFCRECGAGLVSICSRCGFGNGFEDKYCGGCGQNRAGTPADAEELPGRTQNPSGRYSSEDLRDLLQQQEPRATPAPKKKEGKESAAVSQDLLDSIFDSPEQ